MLCAPISIGSYLKMEFRLMHYWRDYMQSLSEWTHSGWNDNDPNWFGYVGHPIQGALTGFIQDTKMILRERSSQFSKTKAYWWSRLKAGLWNAAYSTQWNLGPVSEITVEKYGTKRLGRRLESRRILFLVRIIA